MRIRFGGALKVRGNSSEETFIVNASQKLTPVDNGSSSSSAILDSNYTVISGVYIDKGYVLHTAKSLGSTSGITFTSLNPLVATCNAGEVVRVADGNVLINISDGTLVKQMNLNVSRSIVSTPYNTFTSFVIGSLADTLTNSISSLIAGKTASATTTNVSSSISLSSMPRNPSLWCSSVDLTAISLADEALNSQGQKTATAISPWHVVGAHHWFPSVAYFAAPDGSIVFRNIVSSQQIGSTDIRIGLLDSVLPNSITPMHLFPGNWRSYMPGFTNGISCAYFDAGGNNNSKQCGVIMTHELYPAYGDTLIAMGGTTVNFDHKAFFKDNVNPTIPFNSGSPVFAILGTTPILIGTWFLGGVDAYAPILADHITEINAAMTTLYGSSTYQLMLVDLSSYPAY